jgi:hypothetical protein
MSNAFLNVLNTGCSAWTGVTEFYEHSAGRDDRFLSVL